MVRPTSPIVIAHRGASGYLPEHTLASKALAYAIGAHFLEQDIVVTADEHLVVLHDIHIDRVSNVSQVFPDRHRSDGRYYVRDLTLTELRQLKLHERTNTDGTPVYAERFHQGVEEFRINTLGEELQFIKQLQQAVGRPVGIYPEIKRPAWHRGQGVDITVLCLQALSDAGYSDRQDRIYLQCFDAQELRRIRHTLKSDLKLIQLIGENSWNEAETNFDRLRTQRGMAALKNTVDGVGPWINRLYRYNQSTGKVSDSGLVRRAHNVGLQVHPFTLRKDDLPRGFAEANDLVAFLFNTLGIDGVFTDFPDVAMAQIPQPS